jgi:uncharacterized protein
MMSESEGDLMSRMIFVNLPVNDLPRSRNFWEALGFTFNPQFSDDNAACLVIDDNIFAMLLVPHFFQTFTPRPVADATKSTEVLIAFSVESRDAVDNLVETALAHGGSEPRPVQDHGWMYSRAMADPDGHIWELTWLGEPPAA